MNGTHATTPMLLVALGSLTACIEPGITIINSAPTAEILSHQDGDVVVEQETLTLRGSVGDNETSDPTTLQTTWLLNETVQDCDATPGTDGEVSCEVAVPLDSETLEIKLEVKDGSKPGQDVVTLTVSPSATPECDLESPENNYHASEALYLESRPLSFEATCTDEETPEEDLEIWWTADEEEIDVDDVTPNSSGQVSGSGFLEEGHRKVCVHALDEADKETEECVLVWVDPPNSLPNCGISVPVDGMSGAAGSQVRLEAWVEDANDGTEGDSLVWTSDKDGQLAETLIEDGYGGTTVTGLSTDVHTISISYTDPWGDVCTDSILHTIGSGPSVVITEPSASSSWGLNQTLYFEAEFDDGGVDCSDLELEWESSLDGLLRFVEPPRNSVCLDAWVWDQEVDGPLTEGVHTVTLYVTDADGLTNADVIDVSVGDCMVTWYRDSDADGYGDATVWVESCDQPSGYVANDEDCDDSAVSINPGEPEDCDGLDNNCNGTVDEGHHTLTFYYDLDGDTYGDPEDTMIACASPDPSIWVSAGGDCDDLDADSFPSATELCDGVDNDCNGVVDDGVGFTHSHTTLWYQDTDGDGYGDVAYSVTGCVQPSGHVIDATDCDDGDAGNNPGAIELCDGDDDDCDGDVDEANATGCSDWFEDADGDGFGDSDYACLCAASGLFTATTYDDCDDSVAAINPDADEVCDGLDNDCNGVVDPNNTSDCSDYYYDGDGDGYYASGGATSVCACAASGSYTANAGGDCNDSNASYSPGATETCDSQDNDCDGSIDEGLFSTYYKDNDSDGYGASSSGTTESCSGTPSGYSSSSSDCNDSNASIKPGASESCDSVDNDCDGSIDEGLSSYTYYRDSDSDGYGNAGSTTSSCSSSTPSGYVTNDDDCSDSDSSAYPGALESFSVPTYSNINSTLSSDRCYHDGTCHDSGSPDDDFKDHGPYVLCEYTISLNSAATGYSRGVNCWWEEVNDDGSAKSDYTNGTASYSTNSSSVASGSCTFSAIRDRDGSSGTSLSQSFSYIDDDHNLDSDGSESVTNSGHNLISSWQIEGDTDDSDLDCSSDADCTRIESMSFETVYFVYN